MDLTSEPWPWHLDPGAQDVVAIGAHPDDVEAAFGALVAQAVERGLGVWLIDLTAGEAGTRGDGPTRLGEAAEAARVLGVRGRVCLGLPDQGVADAFGAEQILARWLWALRPRLLLSPAPFDPHPDHGAGARLVARTLEWMAAHRSEAQANWDPPLCLLGAPPLVPGTYAAPAPTHLVPSTAGLERKWRALSCHRSQIEPAGPDDLGEHLPEGLHILERARLASLAFGRAADCEHAEALWAPDPRSPGDPFELLAAGCPSPP